MLFRSVAHASYDVEAIVHAIGAQLRHGRYASSQIYYKPNASDTIVNLLAGLDLYTQKRFCDPAEAGVMS